MGRLNRYGDQIDDEPAPAGADDHSTTCVNGWLGEDHLGRPIPCTTCRPHLTKILKRKSANDRTENHT